LAAGLAALSMMIALAACVESVKPQPTPSPLPSADITVHSSERDRTFYVMPGQSLLILMAGANARANGVLKLEARFPNATLFRAAAIGQTTVVSDYPQTSCSPECNVPAPFQILVIVVAAKP
jgi:hypothetical protein